MKTTVKNVPVYDKANQATISIDVDVEIDVYSLAAKLAKRAYENKSGKASLSDNDVVVVELSLNGTNKGDLEIPEGVISATNKEMHAPCCDVFHLKDGKILSFHCYVAVSILLKQLGIFKNLSAAIKR